MGNKGKRKYACGDCGETKMLHWVELSRRRPPNCAKCGCTFWVPHSDGANEMSINAGTARAIKEHAPPNLGTSAESLMMRGEREVPA